MELAQVRRCPVEDLSSGALAQDPDYSYDEGSGASNWDPGLAKTTRTSVASRYLFKSAAPPATYAQN